MLEISCRYLIREWGQFWSSLSIMKVIENAFPIEKHIFIFQSGLLTRNLRYSSDWVCALHKYIRAERIPASAERFQIGSEVMKDLVHKLIVLKWEQNKMPHEWSTGIIFKTVSCHPQMMSHGRAFEGLPLCKLYWKNTAKWRTANVNSAVMDEVRKMFCENSA
jgi:hypothetical protein